MALPMVKLLMSWDIRPGKEESYFEFVVKQFSPKLLSLGVQPTDAWYTVYGEGPRILSGAVAEDLEAMNRVLVSEDWQDIERKLLKYVTNYKRKVVEASGGFQI
jgi:hypothetical protein